jgi:alkylresorcinol/alkylpyrone synthase
MPADPHIATAIQALPPHRATQAELIAAFRALWQRDHFNVERLEELHRAVKVSERYLALPIDEYLPLDTFAKRNDAWVRAATALGGQAIEQVLAKAGLSRHAIDALVFVTVTGISTPSVDALLANRLRLRKDLKRIPIFGLGCVAGAAGLARAADYLRGHPNHRVLLLAVELCSLTLQREDLSVPNLIASGLFGDGAAAVVLAGAAHPATGPQVVATRSVLYPDTEQIMGWDIVDSGFKVVLSAKVPGLVRAHIGDDVDCFLAAEGLTRSDIRHYIVHTGGPKVLEAFEDALDLEAGVLARSWRSLETVGNLSSASVLFVLSDLMAEGVAKPGDLGLLVAMGPGFGSELVLLKW